MRCVGVNVKTFFIYLSQIFWLFFITLCTVSIIIKGYEKQPNIYKE